MEEETELQALERFVAENDDLLALEEQIGRFNIFDALGIARVEIRHSNYLAWLLTPGESHGQGDLFLTSFLMDVFRKAREQGVSPPISPVELDGADLQGVEIRREWQNIDLLITCEEPRFVIAIENKIDSGEHDGQLLKYQDIITKEFDEAPHLLVYLNPEGDDASEKGWVAYSYANLHRTLIRTRKANAGAIGGDVGVFLEHYVNLVGNRFMENENIDKLCRQIYSNHRRALDLIIERYGSPESGLVQSLEQWVRQRPEEWVHIKTKQKEIEFIASKWDKMLPGVNKRPSFDAHHWMTIRLTAGNHNLRLFVIVGPTTSTETRRNLLDRVLRDKNEFGFATKYAELTEDWTRILSDKICTLPEDDEPDVESVIKKVELRLNEFQKKTANLPAAVWEIFPEMKPPNRL